MYIIDLFQILREFSTISYAISGASRDSFKKINNNFLKIYKIRNKCSVINTVKILKKYLLCSGRYALFESGKKSFGVRKILKLYGFF